MSTLDITLELAVFCAHERLLSTEEKDIDFFLDLWAQCIDEQQRRDLIKSFRRQMICCAAGEALTQS